MVIFSEYLPPPGWGISAKHVIYVFDKMGTFKCKWSCGSGGVVSIRACRDGAGGLLVSRRGERVTLFDTTGSVIRELGECPDGPVGIAVAEGELYCVGYAVINVYSF
jgi:hypothetical protein